MDSHMTDPTMRSIRAVAADLGVSTRQIKVWLESFSGAELGDVDFDQPAINEGLFDRLADQALSQFQPDPPTRRR